MQEKQKTAVKKGVAIMLYIDSIESGDAFYERYIKEFGFPRNRYPHAKFHTDYHVTIGYIYNVDLQDLDELKQFLTTELSSRINLDNIYFEFGMITLIGPSGNNPFIVALPTNAKDYLIYNKLTEEALAQFKHGKYHMDSFTLNKNYFPHLNLYGRVHNHVPAKNIGNILEDLYKKLHGVKLHLSKLKIK